MNHHPSPDELLRFMGYSEEEVAEAGRRVDEALRKSESFIEVRGDRAVYFDGKVLRPMSRQAVQDMIDLKATEFFHIEVRYLQ